MGGTTAQGVKLPCDATYCLVAWPGKRYRAFLERDRSVHQQNFFGSLTTGQENSNGLMYMRNRYYNPLTGAFTQTDPIGLAGGLNTYGYAEGNPVSYSDPYGLSAGCNPPTPECIVAQQLREAWTWLSEKADDARQVMIREGSVQLGFTFIGGPIARASGAALGRLTSIGPRTWRSTAGLIYGPGSKHGNRVRHVLAHAAPDPSKTTHSVFVGGRSNVLPLIDEAWLQRGAPLAHDPGAYVVNMGRAVGTAGEQNIRIVVVPNTAQLVTAYPSF